MHMPVYAYNIHHYAHASLPKFTLIMLRADGTTKVEIVTVPVGSTAGREKTFDNLI